MSKDAIKGLEPKLFWEHFYNISQIPRCSKHEEKVREYVISFAKEKGLEYKEDAVGNIVIKKAATPGYEDKPIAVLQGHLDMVCEKNQGTEHDFSKDPITLVRDGDWMTADGTTLGADNGVAVAAALAIMEDDSIEHGPLEALFTIDEETGLTGATELDPTMLEGKILLNIDSEEEGALYIGCAGGKDTEGFMTIDWEAAPSGYTPVKVTVNGLKGGHSGLDIIEGRGNAVILGNRFLFNLNKNADFRLFNLEGGSKHNAIPREFFAQLMIKNEDMEKLENAALTYKKIYLNELGDIEPDLNITVEKLTATPDKVFTKSFTDNLMNLIYAIPHGVISMSRAVEGLVETSTNMAVIKMQDDELFILTSQRSSVMSARDDIADKVSAVLTLGGARAVQGNGYPAWQPNKDSALLKKCKDVHLKVVGKEAEVKAIHAGLECGIIGDKFEGMDMISFGPDILGAHSPEERVNIKSWERVWNFLLELLKNL